MTNKEYIENLTPEELVQSVYFNCPYSFIERSNPKECKKESRIRELRSSDEISVFVFSGEQKRICDECKLKWLQKDRVKEGKTQ